MKGNKEAPQAPVDAEARLLETTELGTGIYRATIESDLIAGSITPGQFVQIEVSPGTFPLTRRPFTVSGLAEDRTCLEITFEVVGTGTDILACKPPGSLMRILGPLGRGYALSDGPWLLVGGGMGAAGFPLLAEKVDVEIALIGARSAGCLLGCGDVDQMSATEDGTAGKRGLVTDLLDGLDLEGIENAAICGPLPMMRSVIEILPDWLLPRTQVSTESNMGCGWGVCGGCVIPGRSGYLQCCTDGPVMFADRIDWDAWTESIR